tara:strand:+ start:814 stop:2103 length:1290 start_codon:yes stop_codon:yes gene_type:complete
MKKLTTILIITLTVFVGFSQELTKTNDADFNLGNGISFSFNDGDYKFNIHGFIRPSYMSSEAEYFLENGVLNEVSKQFSAKSANLFFEGFAVKEKVSFVIQMDYTSSQPLVESYIGYHPLQNMSFYFGQKQVNHNNFEMTQNENHLRFTERSLLSTTHTNFGEEFGLFFNYKFGNEIIYEPSLAITSGDGKNSFGADSRDTDLGGVKIGSRLNIYPMGPFSEGNNESSLDLVGEEELKVQVGFAFSKNFGVSNSVGDGHYYDSDDDGVPDFDGDFLLYDADGEIDLPNYSQVFFDLLMKYKGFSAVIEYADSSASGIDEIYFDVDPTEEVELALLSPSQISSFLVLGSSFNIDLGYYMEKGYSFDFRFGVNKPEFENDSTLMVDNKNFGLGISKYFVGNNLKLQFGAYKTDFDNGNKISYGEFLIQIVF